MKEAASRLADIAENHLSRLPKAEQASKLKAFRKVVARVRKSAAKSLRLPGTAGSRLSARGRG